MLENILTILQHYAIPFLIVISIVVFVHEFGHYWVARRCGVRVEAFSIGFGKEIFGWNDSHGTRWKISWLPLGGYVKMFGDSGPASTPDATVAHMTDEEKKVAFFYQNVNKRLAIVAAGPGINYLFAIVVLSFLFMVQGQPFSPPRADSVMENSAAAKAGILLGDRITDIDGTKIERFEDIRRIIALNMGTPVTVQVERKTEHLSFTLTPDVVTMKDRLGGEHRLGRIGITTDKIEHRQVTPPQAVVEAVKETWNLTAGALRAMGQMIMGLRGTDELGGPLRIAKMSGDVARDGGLALIWFMAVISVNLGLINLFPVPLLDGGHIMYYLVEKIRGRALHENVQEIGFRIGLVMVLSLMVFATWNDLVQLRVISYVLSLFS